LSTEKLILRQ